MGVPGRAAVGLRCRAPNTPKRESKGEREREGEKNEARGKGSGALWEINQPVGRPVVR